MQTLVEDIIKIQSKGLVTIPKKLRDGIGLKENSLARIRREGRKLVLESVRVVSYKLREYSKREIRQFIKEDSIDKVLSIKATKLLR